MSVNAGVTNNLLWPNYSKENLDRVSPTGQAKQLGQQEFLKILITQLANQDPMQPMQDKEFIAQMAQFTSLEQLMGISGQLTTLQQSLGMSSTLIGKHISWMDLGENAGEGEAGVKTGVVDSIVMRSGVAYARVGEIEIDMANIIEIRDSASSGDVGDNGGSEESEGPLEPPGDAS